MPQVTQLIRLPRGANNIVDAGPAAIDSVSVQFASHKGFIDAGLVERRDRFLLPRHADADRAARVNRDGFSVSKCEYRKLAVDLSAHMVFGRRQLAANVLFG